VCVACTGAVGLPVLQPAGIFSPYVSLSSIVYVTVSFACVWSSGLIVEMIMRRCTLKVLLASEAQVEDAFSFQFL